MLSFINWINSLWEVVSYKPKVTLKQSLKGIIQLLIYTLYYTDNLVYRQNSRWPPKTINIQGLTWEGIVLLWSSCPWVSPYGRFCPYSANTGLPPQGGFWTQGLVEKKKWFHLSRKGSFSPQSCFLSTKIQIKRERKKKKQCFERLLTEALFLVKK